MLYYVQSRNSNPNAPFIRLLDKKKENIPQFPYPPLILMKGRGKEGKYIKYIFGSREEKGGDESDFN